MKNKVELIGYYGSDITHAQSAWTSTVRDLTDEKLNRIDKLLKYLAKEGHHTPFEKSSLHFLVTVDQATHIHLLKHRIGVSINGESARYKELTEDKIYIPDDFGDVEISDESVKEELGVDNWLQALHMLTTESNNYYHKCLEDLTPVLGRKRAKESARFFKTFNSQIDMDIMFNWRSFYHFQNLRNDENSQKEVRELAEEMLNIVKNIEGNPFKNTVEAFNL